MRREANEGFSADAAAGHKLRNREHEDWTRGQIPRARGRLIELVMGILFGSSKVEVPFGIGYNDAWFAG